MTNYARGQGDRGDRQDRPPLTLVSLNIRGLRHKTQHIRNIAHKHKPDFILLQETNIHDRYTQMQTLQKLRPEVKEAYWTVDKETTQSRGVVILKTGNDWTVKRHYGDDKGRIGMVEINNENLTYHLYNIYGPASYDDDGKTFENIDDLMESNGHNEIVIGGDFNATLDTLDSTSSRNQHKKKTQSLKTLLQNNHLEDTYRILRPAGTDVTFENHHGGGTRLDRFYTTPKITPTDIKHVPDSLAFTDHHLVYAQYNQKSKQTQQQATKTHWKFNNTLLENKHFTEHMTMIMETQLEELTADTDVGSWWENMKQTIKIRAQVFGKHQAKLKRDIKMENEKLISYLGPTDTSSPLYNQAKEQLQKIEDHQRQGTKTRCPHQLRNTHFTNIQNDIRNIEQSLRERTNINKIKDKHGNIVTDPEEIATTFKDFYQDLYTSEGTDKHTSDLFTKHAKKLTDEQKQTLESPFTTEEIEKTIIDLNKNKSPGPDGLTAEFYQHFKGILSSALVALYNYTYEKGTFHPNQNVSYITVIPKTNPKSTDPKNYRPISLLNTDYKILTKTLGRRLQPFLGNIIHPNQTCNIEGRHIEDNTHFIRDYIAYTGNSTHAFILSIDQEKAFDRMEHEYLVQALEACNMGEHFCRWVRILYKNPTACVSVNRILSDNFPIKRSVRQGCPLSPLLYMIGIENLLESVREDPKINGTRLPGAPSIKLTAYADDTTFFIDTIKSIELIIQKFEVFGKASGAKINTKKSQVLALGYSEEIPTLPRDLTWAEELKILGIKFSKANKPSDAFWNGTLHCMRRRLQTYEHLNTSIFDRARIANTYIIPMIIYYTKIYTPPAQFIRKMKSSLQRYISGNKSKHIPYNTLIQPTEKGGVNLHDITTKTQTARIKYMDKIIKDPHMNGNTLPIYYIGMKIHKHTPLNHTTPHTGQAKLPAFYQECSTLVIKHPTLIGQGKTNKQIYTDIISQMQPNTHIDIGLTKQNTITAFTNMHTNQLRNTALDISYRLIHSILPTASDTTCPLCNQPTTNEETHLFEQCTITLPAINNTLTYIQGNTKGPIHIRYALKHNMIPPVDSRLDKIHHHLLAETRTAVWTHRNRCKHDNQTPNTQAITEQIEYNIEKSFPDP